MSSIFISLIGGEIERGEEFGRKESEKDEILEVLKFLLSSFKKSF